MKGMGMMDREMRMVERLGMILGKMDGMFK